MRRDLRSFIFPALLLCLGWTMTVPALAGETRDEQLIMGDNTDRIFVPGIRPLGMGGAFIAAADDDNLIFYNPAALGRMTRWEFTFPHMLLGTDRDSFNRALFWAEHADEFDRYPDISSETASALTNTRIHLLTEGALKYVGPNLGFGVWLTSDELLRTRAVLLPEADWTVKASLIEALSFGWGWDIPQFGYLAAGLTFKARQQLVSHEVRNALELANLGQPEFTPLWGGGFDLGLMYQPTSEISVALVAADLYSRIMEEVQPPNLKLGFAYRPRFLNFEDLSTVFAFDLVELNWQGDNEFRNNPNNATVLNLSKVRLGLEFWLARFVALRGGMSQGYPTCGFGLTTPFINLQWAYFGRELGTYPGQAPEWNHRLQIDWHIGGLVTTPTPTPTATPTVTPTPEATFTPTPTATPEATPIRPTPQPTLTGKIPKLHGTFVGFTGTITVVPKLPVEPAEVTSWTFSLTNPRGVLMKRYAGEGAVPRSFVWNGRDPQGNRVPTNVQYPFTLTLNPGTAAAQNVVGAAVLVDTIPKLYTSRNFEVYADKVYFSIKDPIPATESWKLDIIDESNRVVRTYVAKEELFKAFAWDAKDESGSVVANNAAYHYELSILDGTGNQIIVADRLRPVLAQIYQSEGRTTIKVGGILFDTGKAYLTAEMFDKVIKSAYTVNDEPACEAVVDGHTDSTGTKKLNMRLSLVRSESVRRFLVDEQNVPSYLINIQGWGPSKPITSNKTADGRRQNRRAEVIIRLPR